MGDDSARQAFMNGADGTIKLEAADLDKLDEYYKLINPEPCTEERLVLLLLMLF